MKRIDSLSLAVSLSLVLASSAASQQVLRTHAGFSTTDDLGVDGAGLGDVNGDGFGDYVIGAPGLELLGAPSVGGVLVYSGANGAVLYRVDGLEAYGYFGSTIEVAGDVDLDGVTDFFAGAPGAGDFANQNFRRGTGRLISGRSGAVLRSFAGSADRDNFGDAFVDLGDVDGDGVPDHVIGAPLAPNANGSSLVGVARAYSGATGALLYEIRGEFSSTVDDVELGRSFANVGDWTGDGLDDFALSSLDIGAGYAGRVTVRSGATGDLVYTAPEDHSQYRLGSTLASGGDVNGDGVADLLMLRFYDRVTVGQRSVAVVVSGVDQSVLLEIEGPLDYLWGVDALLPGDSNGDNLSEIVLHTRRQTLPGDLIIAEVFSGGSGRFLVNVPMPPETISAWRAPYKIASAGDVNNDGRIDWLISDTGFSGSRTGMVVAGLANFDGTICAGAVNSTNMAAVLAADGSTSVASNSFRITVRNLPVASFGILLSSRTIGFNSNSQLSGRVCIGGGPIGRSAPLAASSTGMLTVPIDLQQVALPNASSYLNAVMPGDTVNWQYWFRDSVTTAPSGVSTAISTRFQ